MAQHKEYDITPRVAYLADGGEAHAATYAISRGGVVVYDKGLVHGPFATRDDAVKAAVDDACRWIDQRGS